MANNKIYLAGSSLEMLRAKRWKAALIEAGFEVVSTWIESIEEVGQANPRHATYKERFARSTTDLAELRSARWAWFLVPSIHKPTKGMWVELGVAYEFRDSIRLVSSGDTRQSIFCALTNEFQTDEEAFIFLRDAALVSGSSTL